MAKEKEIIVEEVKEEKVNIDKYLRYANHDDVKANSFKTWYIFMKQNTLHTVNTISEWDALLNTFMNEPV
jgi:hypothetical protein